MANRVIDKAETQLLEPPAPADNGALARREVDPPAVRPTSILDVIARGIETGMPPEAMEKLFALYERGEAHAATKAYAEAMAAFKNDCPPIPRRTENPQFKVERNGVRSNRKFASLEDIAKAIGPALSKHGLSYRWGDMKIEGGYLTMPCIVTHSGGHSESSMSMPMPIDSKAGCSDQQKVGTAQSYAMRYSLKAALGLTDCDEDTDGGLPPGPTVDENQIANLDALLDEIGAKRGTPRRTAFLQAFNLGALDEIKQSDYGRIVKAVEAKREKQG